MTSQYPATLSLADGSTWCIAPGDQQAAGTLSWLVESMQLKPYQTALAVKQAPLELATAFQTNGQDRTEPAQQSLGSCLLVSFDDRVIHVQRVNGDPEGLAGYLQSNGSAQPDPSQLAFARAFWPAIRDGLTVCVFKSSPASTNLALQLFGLALVIAQEVEFTGGLLLHGALAERDGRGVILAGPGGVGKTTASRRLPHPWQTLCDDTTLVIPDSQGNYWAHPWPTWSGFIMDRPNRSWDVHQAVPLRSLFFLSQAQEERVDPLTSIQAYPLLAESVTQASGSLLRHMDKQESRIRYSKRFDNICTLAKTLPIFRLNLSRTGSFWHHIEQAHSQGEEDYWTRI